MTVLADGARTDLVTASIEAEAAPSRKGKEKARNLCGRKRLKWTGEAFSGRKYRQGVLCRTIIVLNRYPRNRESTPFERCQLGAPTARETMRPNLTPCQTRNPKLRKS